MRASALQELAGHASSQPLLRAELLAASECLLAMATSPVLADVCRMMEAITGEWILSTVGLCDHSTNCPVTLCISLPGGVYEGHVIFTVNTLYYQRVLSSEVSVAFMCMSTCM